MKRSKTERIAIRASSTVKAVLEQAAASVNKSVSELLLDSGLSKASEMLANRKLFALNEEQWRSFRLRLEADPKDKSELQRLLSDLSVFE